MYPLVKSLRKIISILSECIPLEQSLKLRFCKFVKCILSKRIYSLIRHIALCTNMILNEWNNSINEMEVSNVNVLKEMTDIRDGRSECVTLSREDALYIIDDVCLI